MMTSGFTCFPNGGLGEPKLYQNLVCFIMYGDFTSSMSECEELVRKSLKKKIYSLNMCSL